MQLQMESAYITYTEEEATFPGRPSHMGKIYRLLQPSLLELGHDFVFGKSVSSVDTGPDRPVFINLIPLCHIDCHLVVSTEA